MSIPSRTRLAVSASVIGLLTCATLLFQNCQNNGLFVDDLGFDEAGKLSRDEVNSCQHPFDPNLRLDDGEVQVAFKNSIESSDGYCHAERRRCVDGILFGQFRNPHCSIMPSNASDCASPYAGGLIVRNGNAVRAFYIEENGQCISSTRRCTDGVLSGKGNLVACPGDTTCTTPWGLQLGNNEHIKVSDEVGTPIKPGECDRPIQTYTCTSGSLTKATSVVPCNPGACAAPWGTRVENGGRLDAYQSNLAQLGQCRSASNFQVRVCTNGVLSGSFTKPVCRDDTNRCNLPWGGTIDHMATVEAYQTANATGGGICDKQVRRCNNGALEGSSTHVHQTCKVSTRTCGAPWDQNETHAHGTILTGYRAPLVPARTNCAAASIQCIDGSWINGQIYRFKTCVVAGASCTTPWGQVIADTVSVRAYQQQFESAPTCVRFETRTCNNGQLSGSFRFKSCSGFSQSFDGGR